MKSVATAETGSTSAGGVTRFVAPASVLVLSLLPVLLQFVLHGYSSGHDLPFHLGSWQDAARQLRHGIYPQWVFAAALGAGEPRFIFYPPLSWLIGAALSGFLTPAHASESFVVMALAASWLTMFVVARKYTTGGAALVAAALYAAGPYTSFNALERAAYGELLACAWLPLLFAAAVPAQDDRSLPTLRSIAIPLSLLWITNVPTAIIGSYLLVLLTALRLFRLRKIAPAANLRRLALRTTVAVALALLLSAFFLLPALHQSHLVQLNSAFTPGQNYADNFLLHHTAQTRRGNMHVVSVIAAEYFIPLAAVLVALLARSRRAPSLSPLFAAIALAAALALLLLLPISWPLWKYVPELSVLQFPWRLLCLVSLLTALAFAALLAPFLRSRYMPIVAAVLLAWTIGGLTAHHYWLDPHRMEVDGRLRSDDAYDEQRRPTVEYTPAAASNDVLRGEQPAYWLVANANDDGPLSMVQPDLLARVPRHFALRLQRPMFLVLRTRNYPSWTVEINGEPAPTAPRTDGRIALALPAGADTIDLRWHRGWDAWLGLLVSLITATTLIFRSPRRKTI